MSDVTEVRPFQPLDDRLAGLPADDTLHAGVPDWLDQPLRDWLDIVFVDEGVHAERLASRVLIRLRWAKDNPRQSYCSRLALSQQTELLTVVDAVLQLHPAWEPGLDITGRLIFRDKLERLEEVLIDAGSLYRIDFDGRCLVRRVGTTVQAAVDAAIATTTSTVAGHLRTAWGAAYGIDPDPDKAYDHAILAIEELTCPLVCPRNEKATLGVVVRDLRKQRAQWQLSIEDTSTGQYADIDSLIQMLELLWKGQSRHGGNPNSRPQTQAEAEAAVHMAAALTQWLSAGILHRKP